MKHERSLERDGLQSLASRRAVLAASTGGHLSQLVRYSKLINFKTPPLWITFDHPQSRSLLAGEHVCHVPYIAPRDFRHVFEALPLVRKAIAAADPEVVVSTGSALALAVLPQTAICGRRSIYIESVSRFDGPSLSGRLLGLFRNVERYTQHASWTAPNWPLVPSVLSSFRSNETAHEPHDRPLRVFVTLGTIKPYTFESLLLKLSEILRSDDEVFVQSGVTSGHRSDWRTEPVVPGKRVDELVDWADVVVTHAGVGSAMQILGRGKLPVLAIRRAARGEHVDDHQEQVSRYLLAEGLAVGGEVDTLSRDTLIQAAGSTVRG